MVTIADLLREMQSFIPVEGMIIEKAERININSENSTLFNSYLEDWQDGVYDEDPDYLVNDLISIIFNYQ